MFIVRRSLPFFLCVPLSLYPLLCGAGAKVPLGILTQAHEAYLNEVAASPGLSLFDGEDVSTDPDGRLSVRVGLATVSLAGSSSATLHGIEGGAHVDLNAGTVAFRSPENGMVEIHAEEAFLRPEKNQVTQAEVTILNPKVLLIRARRGDLAFHYQEEFQVLPEGETYRIYLDSPAEPNGDTVAGGLKSNRLRKVSYYIMGAAGAGLTAWGVNEFVHSGNYVESPAKP